MTWMGIAAIWLTPSALVVLWAIWKYLKLTRQDRAGTMSHGGGTGPF